MKKTFRQHLQSSSDLETTNEAYRAGFIALALERNHRATPFVERARALQEAASRAKTPAELLDMDASVPRY
jgi:type II restriction enzyme